MAIMQFEHTTKVKDLQKRLAAFMDEHVYPNEQRWHEEIAGQPLAAGQGDRRAEAQGARRGLVEPVSARSRARRGLDQLGIRAAVRDHGPLADGARGVQLLGARHGQHGSAGPVRHARAARSLAQAAAGRRDSLVFRHDRAGRGLVRRHEYPIEHRPRRRSLRDQRPQMVELRRRRPALQDRHLHGQDRPQGRSAQAAVDDPGAAWTRRA